MGEKNSVLNVGGVFLLQHFFNFDEVVDFKGFYKVIISEIDLSLIHI